MLSPPHPGGQCHRPAQIVPLTSSSFIYSSWKGENVATTEVEATLAMVNFIQEVNVYGVSVPGEYLVVREDAGWTKIRIC